MLTLQFVPYNEIEKLSSLGRIKKILNHAKENKIVLLEGRLKKEEEAELIKTTMEEINDEFHGIELAVINPSSSTADGISKLKSQFFSFILGNRQGFTIVGPASVVKEIKKNPNKIELLTQDPGKKRKKSRK